MSTPQNLKPGTLLWNGTYRIESILGQGGFGITYLATDLNLSKQVAIKEFFPENYCNRSEDSTTVVTASKANGELVSKFKEKFLKEAKNIAKFKHPDIINIFAAFEENGTAYYAMEYIEGESLSSIVKRNGPMPEAKALDIVEKIGDALEYIHRKRINHLDVKPANIMMDGDTPILIDFGLSKQYDSAGNQTSTTPVGISHGYAPLEQYAADGVKDFSPQTDLYSLAATLYYLLSGVVPPHATELINAELTFPPQISSPWLMEVLTRAMAPRKTDRQATVAEFVEELKYKGPKAAPRAPQQAARAVSPSPSEATTFGDAPMRQPEITPLPPVPMVEKKKNNWVWIIPIAIVLVLLGVFIMIKNKANEPVLTGLTQEETYAAQTQFWSGTYEGEIFNQKGSFPIIMYLDVRDGIVYGKYAYKSTLRKYGDKEKNYFPLTDGRIEDGKAIFTSLKPGETEPFEYWILTPYASTDGGGDYLSGQFTNANTGNVYYCKLYKQ